MNPTITRTSPQLFRDCLRLIQHIAGKTSPKAIKLKAIVRGEFKKNAKVNDAATVDALKSNAVKALANYLMLESSMKDEKLQRNVAKFLKSETSSIKTHDEHAGGTKPSTDGP